MLHNYVSVWKKINIPLFGADTRVENHCLSIFIISRFIYSFFFFLIEYSSDSQGWVRGPLGGLRGNVEGPHKDTEYEYILFFYF